MFLSKLFCPKTASVFITWLKEQNITSEDIDAKYKWKFYATGQTTVALLLKVIHLPKHSDKHCL